MSDLGTRSPSRSRCAVDFAAGLNLDRSEDERERSLAHAIDNSQYADPIEDCSYCVEEVGLMCPLKDSLVTVEILGKIATHPQSVTLLSRLRKLLTSTKEHARTPLDRLVGTVLYSIGFAQHEALLIEPDPPEKTSDPEEPQTAKGLTFEGIREVQRGIDEEVVRDIGYGN